MSKHTPGPWEETYGKKIYANGRVVAEVMTHEREHEDEDSANARLIAAAPEMLAAIQCALKDLGTGFDGMPSVGMCRAAIAKATGGES